MRGMYTDPGIEYDDNGFPMCSHDRTLCDVEGCRYYVDMFDLGNCSLRVNKDHSHTLEEVGQAMGISRERVRQLQERALGKLRKRFPKMRQQLL